jgi:hypothetical protein
MSYKTSKLQRQRNPNRNRKTSEIIQIL